MITVLCPNLAIDRTMSLPAVRMGAVNRVDHTFVDAGGKGLNVARAVRRLGARSRILGFCGGWTGPFIHEECARHDVEDWLTDITEAVRVCAILVERDSGRTTVLNEPGPTISTGDLTRLAAELERSLADTTCLVITGSLPPGVTPATYVHAVDAAQRRGVRVILDASGDALAHSLSAKPWMIKPNGEEAQSVIDAFDRSRPLTEWGDTCQALHTLGAEQVVLSAGERGAVFSDGQTVWEITPPAVEALNPVGSGDAMVAGIAVGVDRGWSTIDAVRLGVGSGALNAAEPKPELPEQIHVDEVLASTTTRAMPARATAPDRIAGKGDGPESVVSGEFA